MNECINRSLQWLAVCLCALLGLFLLGWRLNTDVSFLSADSILPPAKSARVVESSGAFLLQPNTKLTSPSAGRDLWILVSAPVDVSFPLATVADIVDRGGIAPTVPENFVWRRLGLQPPDEFFVYRSGQVSQNALVAAAVLTPKGYSKGELFSAIHKACDNRTPLAAISLLLISIVGCLKLLGKIGGRMVAVGAGCCALLAATCTAVPSITLGFATTDQDVGAFHPIASFFDYKGDQFLNVYPKGPSTPVKYEIKEVTGTLDATVFATSEFSWAEEPFSDALGGYFASIQLLPAATVHRVLWSVPVVLVLVLLLNSLFQWSWLGKIALLWSSCCSVFASIFYSVGWDELFINLRHSYTLANFGHYSYNFTSNGEATVDFIPFFAAGLLGSIGFNLVDAILVITLGGNILCIIASYLIAKNLSASETLAISVGGLVGLFPCLLAVGGTGFTATFFTGWALLSLNYFLLDGKQPKLRGVILLSMLTLVRTEGVMLAATALAARAVILDFQVWRGSFMRTLRRYVVLGCILAAPFVLSCLVRYAYFGFPVPIPVLFKNAAGDQGFLWAGLFRLKLAVSAFHLDQILIVLVLAILAAGKWPERIKAIALLLALTPFCLSYYSGGGDWFPIEWNRYGMPLTIALWVVAFIALFEGSRAILGQVWIVSFILFAVFFHSAMQLRGGTAFWGEHLSWLDGNINRWGRVRTLASFGRLLKNSTPENAVVASPEMSTIMYFAERNLLDLLGIANPDIALSKLDPLSPGDLMHRKRNPGTLDTHLPEIIAAFEMAHQQPTAGAAITLEEAQPLLQAHGFSESMINYGYYRLGSYQHLLDLGYRHVAVFYKNMFFNYFVSNKAYDDHLSRLRVLGFIERGSVKVSYTVPAETVSRFSDR